MDTITIYSTLNKMTSVSFKIDSKSKRLSNFRAYFVGESDDVFDINPKFGEMHPFGSDP